MAYGTSVQANGVVAVTPLDHLLLTKTKAGLMLDDADGFITFAAVHNDTAKYGRVLAEGKLKAKEFKTIQVSCRGTTLDVHMARFGDSPIQLVYYTYFESRGQGISAQYTHRYFATVTPGVSWLDTVPVEFVHFVNSVEAVGETPPQSK